MYYYILFNATMHKHCWSLSLPS